MSFGDHTVLWLQIVAAVFAIVPGTAAIMSTPRYIRKQDVVVLGYLFRVTRVYAIASLLVLVFGLALSQMLHKFSKWWIPASITLYVVAAVLLVLIMRDQRRAMAMLESGSTGSGATTRSDESEQEPDGGEDSGGEQPAADPAPIQSASAQPQPAAQAARIAAVERGRIRSMSGVVALIWLAILVLMVWNS